MSFTINSIGKDIVNGGFGMNKKSLYGATAICRKWR